jgi:CheY-like chemotaxis protein
VRDTAVKDEETTVPVAPKAGTSQAEGAVIAVAEDHAPSRMLIHQILTKGGYHVRAAANGEELLRQIREEPPDVVLMDIQMPKMDGITATQLIRAGQLDGVSPTVPIVAITAHALPGDQERFLSVGMDGYLAKPITRERLFQVLDHVRDAKHGGSPEASRTQTDGAGNPPETPPKMPADVLHLLDELVAAVNRLREEGGESACLPLAQRLRTKLTDLGATDAGQNLFRLVLALRRNDTEKIDPLLQELSHVLRAEGKEAVALSEREDR